MRYLPPGASCTAFWYASQAGLMVACGPDDLSDRDFLRELGAQAACRAGWHGIPAWQVRENGVLAWMRPEWVWEITVNAMARSAAEYGDYQPRTQVVHCGREPYDVLIDRTTPWGNPFVIGRDGDRGQVIARYEQHLLASPGLLAALPQLRGKVLGCWCAPQPCHGDVLARYADGPEARIMEIYHALPDGPPVRDPGCERCDYDTHRCPGCGEPLPHGTEVCRSCGDGPVPPWCPLPQGDQARFAIGY